LVTAKWLKLVLLLTEVTTTKTMITLTDHGTRTARQDRQDVSARSCFSPCDVDDLHRSSQTQHNSLFRKPGLVTSNLDCKVDDKTKYWLAEVVIALWRIKLHRR